MVQNEEIQEAIYAALLKLPIIEENKLDYYNVPLYFSPDVDRETEYITDSGLIASTLRLSEDDPNYYNFEFEQTRGNLLNTSLDVLCEHLELERPFWSVANEMKMETYLRKLNVGSDAVFNLYWILRELLGISDTKGQWKSKVNQNSFNMLMENSLPHTLTLKNLNRKKIERTLKQKKVHKGEEYPIFSLFDIIYLSLRTNTVDKGIVHLKVCSLCDRLFFVNRSDRKYCLLDAPGETCDDRYRKRKGSSQSKRDYRYTKATRMIMSESKSSEESESNHNSDYSTFWKSWNKIGKSLDESGTFIIDKQDKQTEYLDAFIERYTPERPIEEIIEESMKAVGL